VQEHGTLMGKGGKRANLVGLVNGSNLRGLGNRNDSRLNMVLIADSVVSPLD